MCLVGDVGEGIRRHGHLLIQLINFINNFGTTALVDDDGKAVCAYMCLSAGKRM